jgi:hypothetical protein
MSKVDIFDPADQEIGPELVPTQDTPESAHIPDTNADPEGVEAREAKPDIALPDFFFKKYMLDANGNPTFNPSLIDGVMDLYDSKVKSEIDFSNKDDAKKEQEYYDTQVQSIADGLLPLLEVDPQTTGISVLQHLTRTFAEFLSVNYEYSDSISALTMTDDIPTWLTEREDKMFALGRKFRLCRDAINSLDDKFGLKDTSLKRERVQAEIERRMQRLAEWNFKQHADTSGKTNSSMNKATADHCKKMAMSA